NPAYLILDVESVPDGRLIRLLRYPGEALSDEQAIQRYQQERLQETGRDFIPVTFQVPVAISVARVADDLSLLRLTRLGEPTFQLTPGELVRQFWNGLERLFLEASPILVTFNGRCFDLPLLELAGFRYGVAAPQYFQPERRIRNRFGEGHLDLSEFLSNFGALRLTGGLDLFSHLLGKPGKFHLTGDQVYAYYRAGQLAEINDYCAYDVLDTYFVFLRTRVLVGQITLEHEQHLVRQTRAQLEIWSREPNNAYLRRYLDNWGDWQPWP
ncbi:MAG: 3'-5' exonuclease, partial [Gemmatales bacterium]|nr:3'-5' exonuclease [Gemmatales bacterium]MDW8175639.1 3'-5' exonuclease [Gemmatales bacterium]